ncbi:MAG: hypothetical protein ACTS8S_19180, partial [Giesbergeria sp.]
MTFKQYHVDVTTGAGSTATLQEMYGTASDTSVVIMHTATDDGAGSFLSDLGTVDYVGKAVSLRVLRLSRTAEGYKSDYEDAKIFDDAITDGGASPGSTAQRGGEYTRGVIGDAVFAGSSIVARYRVAPAVPQAKTMTYTPPSVVFDLAPYTSDAIVPGSVMFDWMGQTYQDFEGVIYRDRSGISAGIASGILAYDTGKAIMTDWVVGGTGPADFQLLSLWTRRAPWSTASIFFRTQSSPIKPSGFVMNLVDAQGNAISATGDLDGRLTGPHMNGTLDYQTGVGQLQFGDFVLDSGLSADEKAEWWYDAADVGAVEANKIWRPWPVDPTTLRYNSVSYFY